MKITDVRVPCYHFFNEIPAGAIFEIVDKDYSNDFFMKIHDIMDKNDDCFNAINLHKSELETFCPMDKVIEVNAELVVSCK